MLPDEKPSAEQFRILRGLTGQERLRIAEDLYWTARKLKAAGVRSAHPDWSDEQVRAEVNRLFSHASS